MDEIFKTYRPHRLIQRMLSEVWRREIEDDAEIRDLAIDLISDDLVAQGIVANRGQIGWWYGEQIKEIQGLAELNTPEQ